MTGPLLEARGLDKSFGAHRVLRGVDVAVPPGSVTCLIGPSGSGKTTVLRSLNGLETPEAGTVRIGDVELDWATRPDARAVSRLRGQSGMVFQAHNLFPHFTVAQNIAVVPGLLKWDKKKIDARVDEMMDLVGLDPATFRHRLPRQLSGGQQ